MQNVYSVEIEQLDRENPNGVPMLSERYDIKARTLEEAIRRARTLAKGNGFFKTYPLVVKSANRVVTNLQ
jgi:hypothetical protein